MIWPFLPLLMATVPSGHRSLTVTVFYDENGNGILDPGERVRLPDVLVEAGGASGRTERGTGRVVLSDLAEGPREISVSAETLPPFFKAGPPVRIQEGDREVVIPVGLPIGTNRPNTYLAFGDSLTAGEGSRGGQGYRLKLESRLRHYLGDARVIADGVSGANTDRGIRRIREALSRARPAYTVVLLGTNDWDDAKNPGAGAEGTVANLRIIVRRIRAEGSIPFVATLPPPNVGFDWRAPRERDVWVSLVNQRLGALASEEGAGLVDLYGAFKGQVDLPTLFADHLHPNDRGYDLIAETLFEAIVGRHSPPSAGSSPAPKRARGRLSGRGGVHARLGP
jgi:acyl-CoA thioesterase-1